MTFRWEVNVQTGERKQIPLTETELADLLVRKDLEEARQAAFKVQADAKATRQAHLNTLLAKIEADPTILDRIK